MCSLFNGIGSLWRLALHHNGWILYIIWSIFELIYDYVIQLLILQTAIINIVGVYSGTVRWLKLSRHIETTLPSGMTLAVCNNKLPPNIWTPKIFHCISGYETVEGGLLSLGEVSIFAFYF